eukprot:Partr_v1_DN26464_c0_g1_i2_m23956 putative pyrophosphorylase
MYVESKMSPLPDDCFDDVDLCSAESIKKWRDVGLKAIGAGQIGVILLAGGQGTRLGSSAPKGCYDIGLPSHKSLFRLQAERILRLQALVKSELGKEAVIPWYVMTSGPTRSDTEKYFVSEKYFGLDAKNVVFFNQGVLPALTKDGKIILEDKGRVSVAPDGNGGVYAGLRTSKVLEDMKKRGLTYLHAYCVDNCLVRVGDPIFLGYCISKQAACGAKVVRKAFAHEPVGVVCKVNGKFGVVEYSEIQKVDAEAKRADGRLLYDAANIANHFYSLDFLTKVCGREFENQLAFHVAHKKIKHINLQTKEIVSPSTPNGIKLELFIFDIFPMLTPELANSKTPFAVLSVPRTSEFSPLKNAPGAGVDNPETSRRDLCVQSSRFLTDAGAKLSVAPGAVEKMKLKQVDEAGSRDIEVEVGLLEISPLVCYDGEGLDFVKGKTISVSKPTYVASVEDLKSLISI